MQIGKYTLVNVDKIERALNGSSGSLGALIGGIGQGAYYDEGWKRDGEELSEEDVETLESSVIVEYDRIGGLIKEGNDKIATGSFYNAKAKKAHDTPVVRYEYRVNDKLILVPEHEQAPLAVRAAKMLAEGEEEAPAAKKSWKKKTV